MPSTAKKELNYKSAQYPSNNNTEQKFEEISLNSNRRKESTNISQNEGEHNFTLRENPKNQSKKMENKNLFV
uniref:Uncharacterized protein n=1 Tax=Meloidogyne enterolobii TaxID=390850 RepID=A0A6V7W116_MELEN|nr:unnamed protein product [Meloidogyne enterolobii]